MDREEIRTDFDFLKQEDILGVLLYGSQVKGRDHERSDIDICIVAPKMDTREVLRKTWSEIGSEKYDIHTFDELSLKVKNSVVRDHEVIWARNSGRLQEHLQKYRRIWEDQAKARGVA